jgi:hypothetical protein
VAALVGSGQLQRGVPPLVSRPTTTALWPGLRPPVRTAAGPVRHPPVAPTAGRRTEPDDDTLEAEPLPLAAARTG